MKLFDIYSADLSPVAGSEQGRIMPVVIMSNTKEDLNTVLCTPITTKIKNDSESIVVKTKSGEMIRILLGYTEVINKSRLKEKIDEVLKTEFDNIKEKALSVWDMEQLIDLKEQDYIETHEICRVCGKRFYGVPVNIHGSYEYINHTNFSNNIGVMFARTKGLPREQRADAIVKEFFIDFIDGNDDKVNKKDAIEFLECFKHYKCDDKELLEEIFDKIQIKIDSMK